MDSPPETSHSRAAPEPVPAPEAVSTPAAGVEATGAPAEAASQDAAVPPPLISSEPFVFHGTTRDYFRIWIVNTLLTLLTLGVFLAWAKVRKRRYLRGCCELMGHRFDYRADPRRILLGNFIAVTLFLAYSVAKNTRMQVPLVFNIMYDAPEEPLRAEDFVPPFEPEFIR